MHKSFLLLLPLLAACGKPPAAPEPLRPVKTVQIGMHAGTAELSVPGEVSARHETPMAFRVGGKISRCKVNLGDTVRRGQLLAQLEPTDYQLASQSGAAGLAEAKSTSTLADADLARYRSLRKKGFISAAMLDQKQGLADVARAHMEVMLSTYSKQSRQLDYTSLTAPNKGLISAYDCNEGQVVNAGQTIMRFAQSGEKEIVIHLPEAALQDFRSSSSFGISLNALPGKSYRGSLRELSAAADPATRTYAARIAVNDADSAMQLGMSATVEIRSAGKPVMRLPLIAVFSKTNNPTVWKVDNTGTVHAAAITIGSIEGDSVRIASGLVSGDVVVTAGTHLLREGEKVKLLP